MTMMVWGGMAPVADRAQPEVVSIVLRAAREQCSGDCCAISASLDACVEQVVGALWSSRVKGFVPLLALRDVRECIRLGACSGSGEQETA